MSVKVNVDLSGLKKLEAQLLVTLNKTIANPNLKREVGDIAIKDIQFQTRRGVSIPLGGRFKPLSKSWIERRKEIISEKHPTYSDRRSNLTVSGQLLNALFVRLGSKGSFDLDFQGTHRPYTVRGKRVDSYQLGRQMPNKELAEYVSETRPFMGLRLEVQQRAKVIVIEHLRRSSKVFRAFNS